MIVIEMMHTTGSVYFNMGCEKMLDKFISYLDYCGEGYRIYLDEDEPILNTALCERVKESTLYYFGRWVNQ